MSRSITPNSLVRRGRGGSKSCGSAPAACDEAYMSDADEVSADEIALEVSWLALGLGLEAPSRWLGLGLGSGLGLVDEIALEVSDQRL